MPTTGGVCAPDPPVPDPARVSLLVDVSKATGIVSGQVSSGAGRSSAGARIVLIPTNGPRLPDRYRLGVADDAGKFRLSGVPPGAYTAFAFEGYQREAYYDPEFANHFKTRGTPTATTPQRPSRTGNTQEAIEDTQQYAMELNLIPVADMGEWAP